MDRRDFLKRTGAFIATGGKIAKALVSQKMKVDEGVFQDGVEMVRDGVFKFKDGWLRMLASADLYKYLGYSDNEVAEIQKIEKHIDKLTKFGKDYSAREKAERERLIRTLENNFSKKTITDAQIGDVLGRSNTHIAGVNGVLYWLKNNGANSDVVFKTFKNYVRAAGGAKKVMEEIKKYTEWNEARINEILEIPDIDVLLPELDDEFIEQYEETRRRYDEEDEYEDDEYNGDEHEEAEIEDQYDYGRDDDLDWYDKSKDPFLKTKERFHESKRRHHCFTEGYRALLKSL